VRASPKNRVAAAGRVRADINVTPLVDVVLVLLIIFMVVTPMLQTGPAVRVPVADDPPKKPDDARQTTVVIEHDKMIWINKVKVTEANFPAEVAESYQRNPGGSAVIKADARLDYGTVKRAMVEVKNAGFKSVGLIASKREAAAP
jgi:biopolymer transport protein ExbD